MNEQASIIKIALRVYPHMLTGKIKNQIDQVWTMFWTGGVSNPISVIEQISYLLFIRRLDEIQRNEERKAQATGESLENPIFSSQEAMLRWNNFKDKDPNEMFDIVQNKVFPKIKNLQSQGSFAEHMKDAIFMIPSPKLLDQVVQMLDNIDMNDKDTKGDLYEYLLSKLSSAGVNGQFRTPRHIIKMMVELMKPQINDTICDPAAGTCGFLMSSVEYIREHYQAELTKADNRKHFNNGLFTAYDFDRHMLRIGAMNMLLHGIENPAVYYRDSLQDHNDANISEAYSLMLANPPFKGSVDFDIVASDLLRALGKNPAAKKARVKEEEDEDGKKKKKGPTEKSELLFLALILRMLKTGGRAAVIVPDGVLFGSTKSHKSIRQKLVKEQKLQAVISLPSGVFKPYAGVSTAILIFTKTNSGGTDKVWFYDMQADGYSLDDKRTKLFKDGEEPSHEQSNIADILARYASIEEEDSTEAHRKRTEQSFMVPLKDIEANDYDLSLNRYKEVVYEEVEYDEPKVILQRIKDLQKKMADGVKELEGLL
ncbi:Type I restriction-modification system methyltransferase subunit [Hahella chejuensis KCTC 2396]|uniref:site-specific DNA-methyltransferase (adenine-specific) n=1 Tax=Hahella chejuensis (strain KCTC 2396) TaxID=349521 RepID=Q2SCB2_HAHCH|nr:class I SAM-dependent DNA methyltransferase [Hahella chejuensis]ABC31712.1 Type I restriction-modification system methyltransferase subunit [Hahella chejuensis KCTC 2396]